MLENLRPLLTKILEPFAKRMNINPNILTLISPFIALAAAYSFSKHLLILATIFILLSGFLDVADGAVARYHNRASKFGAFFDSTMDRISDAILIIGIIFGGYCNWLLGILLIHSAIMVSYVKARSESQGIECNTGIAERAVRLIIIMIGSIVSAICNNPIIFTYFLIILMILSYITVAQRFYHSYKQLKIEGNNKNGN